MANTVIGEITTVSATSAHRAARARRFFGVVAQPQSYLNVAYLILGLPLGIVWFTVLVTGVAVGTSILVVALAGIPCLVGLWYVTRSLANLERGLANVLLGTSLVADPMDAPTGNLWRRLRTMTSDTGRWREVAYLMARFPAGVATFVVAVSCLTISTAIVYAPLYARYVADHTFGDWALSTELHRFATSSPWSWLLIPLGGLCFVVSLHVMNALAAACGRWTTSWLGGDAIAGDRGAGVAAIPTRGGRVRFDQVGDVERSDRGREWARGPVNGRTRRRSS
jgi:hypothetical protein